MNQRQLLTNTHRRKTISISGSKTLQEGIMSEKYDGNNYHHSEKNCEKVACKYCGKEFAYILKHLANSSICKSVYQENELNSLRLFSKSISDANKKIKAWKNYNSEDRAKKYQKEKHKVAENYYLDGLVKDQVELSKDASDERIECKCKRSLRKTSILKHIAHTNECKNYYKLPSSKEQLNTFKMTSRNESKRKKGEKLLQEKEEKRLRLIREDLLKKKTWLSQYLDQVIQNAKKKNFDGMTCAQKEFELEFERFKSIKMPNEFQDRITKLQNDIQDTFTMFETDIANLSQAANTVFRNLRLESDSLSKGSEYIQNLFEPLVGTWAGTSMSGYGSKNCYPIRYDWHDTRLKIDLELNEIAKVIKIPFQRRFNCTQVVGVCRKCIKTET